MAGRAVQAAHLRLSSVQSQHQGIALRQKRAVRTVRCRQAAQVRRIYLALHV